MELCPKCKLEMHKGVKLDSGNSKFQEWICPGCNFKVTRALGINT